MRSPFRSIFHSAAALLACGCLWTAAHAQDTAPEPDEAPDSPDAPLIFISVPEQRMTVIDNDSIAAEYRISTSKFGLGDQLGSYKTPLGEFRVRQKIGGHLPIGAVIKNRSATGEIVTANAPGRDAIVTRVLWLEGLEVQNRNAYHRGIYIHGTPEEFGLGQPISWGCVRMGSKDIIQLFEAAPEGTVVKITQKRLGDAFPHLVAPRQPANIVRRAWTRYRLRLLADIAEMPQIFSDIRATAKRPAWLADSARIFLREPSPRTRASAPVQMQTHLGPLSAGTSFVR